MMVVLIVVGVAALWLVSETMANADRDPRELPHDYQVTGTLEGEECSGTAHLRYTNESQMERVYVVDVTFDSASSSRSFSFGIVIGRDDVPVPSLYTGGETQVLAGETVHVWHQTSGGAQYSICLGEQCRIPRMDIVATDYSVALALVS